MQGIGGRGDEIEMLVERARFVMLRVHHEGADAGNVGGL